MIFVGLVCADLRHGKQPVVRQGRRCVARGDYAFSSHPFSDMPNRQLMYAAELGWFDARKLEGFADEACEILAEGICVAGASTTCARASASASVPCGGCLSKCGGKV